MDLHDGTGTQVRFHAYAAELASVLGHADRVRPFEDYCIGLLSAEGRKSVEPLAAVTAPERTAAQHQSLLHLVAQAPWSDQAVLTRVRERVLPTITRNEPIQAWIIDDTGFPKKGSHSVGVARQYCGQLGKQDNCQVAVSVTLACQAGSLPVAWQLYLPKEWAADLPRRERAGVPQDVEFATKPAIALAQIERLMAQGAPRHCVLADAGYGVETAFRERLTAMGLPYVVGVTGQVTVWPPGHEPLPPEPYSGRGNVPTRQRLGQARHQRPLSVKELAFELPAAQWQSLEWREGTNFTLRSRFARVRVRAAHRDHQRSQLRCEEWLLIEWPEGHREPMKYWLSTLPEDTPLQRMVLEAKMRWRIERDYQDLKQELGLGHYEGRGWRGFHHHASLSIAAYGFLMVQQLRHPEGAGKKNAAQREEPALPTHYKPRGSPAHAAPRPIVHHDFAAAYRRRLAQDTAPMSVLPARKRKATFVTQ